MKLVVILLIGVLRKDSWLHPPFIHSGLYFIVYTGATLPGREVGGVEYVLVPEHYHGKVFCDLFVGIVPTAEKSNHGNNIM